MYALATCRFLPRCNSPLRTTSVHPMENGTRTHPMNPEIFVGRCLFLQNHGFNVTVNVVAWPEQMYLIPAWAEMFRSHRPAIPRRPVLVDRVLPVRVLGG